MLKKLHSLAFIIVSISAIAQSPITITSSDMPNENDSIHISIVAAGDYINVPNPSGTGANYSWDYTSLSPNAQMYERYSAPADFTSPYNYFFNLLNTSYGKDNYEFSTIPLPNVNISAAYDFYKEGSSELKQIGAGYIINDIPLPFLYEDNDNIYEFPMTYLSTSNDSYKYGLDIPGIGYYGQSGTRSNTVDGWGTLTTPFGTFQTIRLKSTVDAVDTVYNTSLMVGANIPRPLKHEYKWMANGKKIPVLKIETTVIAGNEAISNVRYIDSVRSDVPQVGINELAKTNINAVVYPNPCINELNVSYNLPFTTSVKITLADITGKKVALVDNKNQNLGEHKNKINTSGLDAGIYFITIQTDNSTEIKKITITK